MSGNMFSKIRTGVIWALVSSDQKMRLDSVSDLTLICNTQSSPLVAFLFIYVETADVQNIVDILS